jgi:hypothetical protein
LGRFLSYAKEQLASGAELDIQAIEKGFRAAALHDGDTAFRHFLSMIRDGEQKCPQCQTKLTKIDEREKTIVSLMGTGAIKRTYYECPNGHGHFVPRDGLLGVQGTSFTPGVRLSVSKLAAAGSFEWAHTTLEELAGVCVSAKEAQRISEAAGEVAESKNQWRINDAMAPVPARSKMDERTETVNDINATFYIEYDGTGVPMTRRELDGRKGKQPDGGAKTREVKVGCTFTQSALDDDGNPLRDDNSTSYFGSIETADKFGWRVFSEALRRNAHSYARTAIIGDGAKWIWGIASQHFPDAIQIVDLYHAKEHLYELTRNLFPNPEERALVLADWIKALEDGDVAALSEKILAVSGLNETQLEKAQTEAAYFTDNADRMRYKEFKDDKLFVGSGVVEAACKTVVGARLKQSGMFWSVRGANAIIALRCTDLSCDGDFYSLFKPKNYLTSNALTA